MLKIWGRANSVNVQKAVWAAAETGVAFERVDAGMAFGKNNEDWYLELNPNGKIPLLQHEGFSLWESNVIVRYLCQTFSMGKLCPEEVELRFLAEQWMDWTVSELGPAMHPVFWGLVRTPPEKETSRQSNQESRPVSGFSRCSTSTFSTRVLFAVRISPWGTFLRERWLIDGSIWKSTVPRSRHYRNGMRNCWNVRPTESTWSCH